METELENLRREVANVKAAHPFAKAAAADRVLDAVVVCIAGLDRRLSQLEERSGLTQAFCDWLPCYGEIVTVKFTDGDKSGRVVGMTYAGDLVVVGDGFCVCVNQFGEKNGDS